MGERDGPKILSSRADIEAAIAHEQRMHESFPLHCVARKRRAEYMLSDYPTLMYGAIANGTQSLALLRLKLVRLLDLDRDATAEGERAEFDLAMSCAAP